MTTKKTDNTELATTNDTEIIPTVTVDDVISSSGFINTVDMTKLEGKVSVANAVNSATSLKDAPESIDVIDCITMPGVRKGRNNMPDTDCTNVYLIDTEGKAWFSQSDGIARSVRLLASLFPDFGKSLPQGALHVKVVEQQLNNGNTLKTLALDM